MPPLSDRANLAGSILLTLSCIVTALCPVVRPLAAQQPKGTLSNPAALLVDAASHSVYAVDTDHNTVIYLDEISKGRTLIPVARSPIALALDAPLHRLYVVCAGAGVAQAISTTTHQVVASIPTDHRPYAIAADPVRHQVFVTNTFSNVVTAIDAKTNTSRSLPLGSKDTALVDPVHGRVYFTSYEDPTVTELDETSGAVRHLPAAGHTWALVGDWPHQLLYAAVIGSNQLLTMSLEPGTTAPRSRSTPSMPDAVLLTPAGQLITANYAADSVAIFAPDGAETFVSVPTAPHPVGVAFLPQTNTLLVISSGSSTLTAIDLTGRSASRTLPAGKHPFAIAVDPILGRIYTAGYDEPLTMVSVEADRSAAASGRSATP